MRLLITGASGFIGQALTVESFSRGFAVRVASRSCAISSATIECVVMGNIDGGTDWHDALRECDVVVHLASRVHVINDASTDPLEEFRKVNVHGTLNLARQAAIAGIKRFIFISSIGVNGAETINTPFDAEDMARPHSPYTISKYEAELCLQALAVETFMEIVIIRPPLVYGPNAPGRFGSLMRWLNRGLPLPLGGVTHNRRSLVALDNLIDLILTCVEHPKAANQIFLVSDGVDLSTTELLQRIGKVINSPVYLLPVPPSILTFVATLLGRKMIAQSLFGSLQIDISKTCDMLNWNPPVSVDEGLRRAVK